MVMVLTNSFPWATTGSFSTSIKGICTPGELIMVSHSKLGAHTHTSELDDDEELDEGCNVTDHILLLLSYLFP